MLTALLNELKKKEKIKNDNIEFYAKNGELRVLVGKKVYVIKDNNALINLGNKNHKISEAVENALENYF